MKISKNKNITKKNSNLLFKILLLGDSGVGKSCIILRYTENIFSQNLMNSIGVDFKLKTIEIDNKIIKLQIWDTAGEERFRTITTSYYKGAQVIIIVYDVTDNDSFEHVKNWINEIDKFAKKDVLKILVGNKCDLISQRKVSTQQGNDLANYYKIPFLETSAKDNNNIEELFVDTCKFFLSKQGNSGNVTNEKKNEREKIDLTGTIIPTDRKKKKCCG